MLAKSYAIFYRSCILLDVKLWSFSFKSSLPCFACDMEILQVLYVLTVHFMLDSSNEVLEGVSKVEKHIYFCLMILTVSIPWLCSLLPQQQFFPVTAVNFNVNFFFQILRELDSYPSETQQKLSPSKVSGSQICKQTLSPSEKHSLSENAVCLSYLPSLSAFKLIKKYVL